MSGQAASIGSLISSLLLSDFRILRLSWTAPFTRPLEWSELREPTYLAYQPWAARFPDHVFDSSWQFLVRKQPRQGAWFTALEALVGEFLELRHANVRIRRDLLGAWQQGLASRVSTIPIQAAADVLLGAGQYARTSSNLMQYFPLDRETAPWRRQIVPLLRPEEAPVANYVEREGLHETHLHLNGSTFAEICWLRALRNPHAESRKFVDAWTSGSNVERVRELVGQANPDLIPQVFYKHLRTAGRLRTWLIAAANGQLGPGIALPVSCEWLCDADNDEWSAGLRTPSPGWRHEPDVEEELAWMARLVIRLGQTPGMQLGRMFHTYLLLLNEYYRLLVQGEAQYGFDQFQKFTLTELREPAEQHYRTRFHAMHGHRFGTSTIGYLEGRFAPKDNLVKAYGLFKDILGGYLEYLRDATSPGQQSGRRPRSLSEILIELDIYFERPAVRHRSVHRLALVAHFIKQSWSPAQRKKAGPYQHYPLDRKLRRTAGLLLYCLARWPRLQNWVRGIDAAANELHAPPDVFAPVFRVCRRAGLTRCTYHVGEDFRHLMAGIASMWEALTLLDLRDGDRLGHGTAMGISPGLWLERMPATLTLSRGEWMLSLLAVWQLLRDVPETYTCARRVERELENIACQIFLRSLTAQEVERAMALRGLSRQDLMRHRTGQVEAYDAPLSVHWAAEVELVRSAFHRQPQDTELLWEWLSDFGVLARADELIATEAGFLDAPTYVRLQQALMRKVAERGVLIETLPSSNVRISQYQHISEHHSLRWLRVPGHVLDGDPEIMVCLGSDDPGVFAGDLETEFYLLYGALKEAGLGDSEAVARLSVLNERGRIYRFHHPSLS